MTLIIDGGNASSSSSIVYDGGDASTVFTDPDQPYSTPTSPRADTRMLWLESMDGGTVLTLNETADQLLLAGATGLMLPPLDVVTSTTPGMVGSWLQEINVLEREVFLPLEFSSDESHDDFMSKLTALSGLISGWDGVQVGQTGTFRLCASSPAGERLLTVAYKSGWEGNWGGTNSNATWEKIGLTLVAVDPYWRTREPEVQTYRAPADSPVFLGSGDGTHPFPRQISQSVVIGNNMPIIVDGDVPTWASVEIDGLVSEASISWPGTSVAVPAGIPDGSTLVLNTDPRARSARLDGAVAWSSITMGATFAPLVPGKNLVSVEVGTSGPDTGLTLQWTPGWRSAFG
jgi:hypothetical protein